MNEHDKNFLINMSPFLIMALVMFFIMVAFETKADEEIVGHTFDGHAIYKSDTKIDGIRVNDIRGSSYNRKNNTLTLKLKKKTVEVHFYNNCFELAFANNLGFKSFGSLSKYTVTLRRGDAFIPISFGRAGMPCTIKAIYEIIEEEKNDEEN
jgi:hypothetical protein